MTTDLVRIPSRILTQNEQVSDICIKLAHAGYNVLGPRVITLGPAQGFAFSSITLNPDDDRECYHDRKTMRPDERALTKVALDQIAMMAGINWLPSSNIQRLEDHHVIYTAHGEYHDATGAARTISGSREIDLRDNGTDTKGMSPAQLAQARKFLIPMAESKAKNRAVRQAMGLKQKYTVEELKRPIVVLRAVPMPDTSDPVIARMVAARALGFQGSFYPQLHADSQGPLLPVPAAKELTAGDEMRVDVADDPTPLTEPTPAEVWGRVAPPEQPPEPEPPQPPPLEDDDGDGRLWTISAAMKVGQRWVANSPQLPDGEYFVTTDAKVAMLLTAASLSKGKQAVRLVLSGDGPGHKVEEIRGAVERDQ